MEQNLNVPKQPVAPEPPGPEISVRTMESDIKALEQGGGEMIAPEYFTPEQVKPEKAKTENKFNITGYGGPEKAIFSPPAEISTSREKEKLSDGKKSLKWKFIGIIIAALIIIAGFGLLGYFVISKIFFPAEMPPA